MISTNLIRRVALGMAATLTAALGIPAIGQAQEIGEIVVTARRVEEKLMEVPLAITAFDSAAIESAAITNLTDVAALTPGLYFFSPIGESLPAPIIRGVVSQDIFGENTAAIFVDGVYVSGRAGLNFSQLDVERIEVLKGPQSAIYGRNAFSGAINYVTKPPTDTFETKAEVEAGNRNRQKVVAQVSGPIFSDTLTGRFSALYDEWDGSYDNSLAPENDIGGYRYRSFQGRLRWRPADALDVNLGLYYSNDEIDEPSIAALPANCEDQIEQTTKNAAEGPWPRLQNVCGEIPDLEDMPDALDRASFPNPVVNPNSVTQDSMPKLPEALGEDRDILRGSLSVNWDLDFGTFTFLTGYTDTEQRTLADFGRSVGNTIPLAYCTGSANMNPPACTDPTAWSRAPMGFIDRETPNTTEEWSQEIRFTSPRDQRLRYLAGAYVYDKDFEEGFGELVATTQLPGSILEGGNIAVGPVAYPTALAIGTYIFGPSLSADGAMDPLNRPETRDGERSWSVFAAADFDVTDAIEARAEIRRNQDLREANAYEYTPCGDVSTFPLQPSIGPPRPVADCGDDFYDLRVLAPERVTSGSERFDSWTGRVGLKYKFESGWLLYGSVAKGEKPGGLLLVPADVVLPDDGDPNTDEGTLLEVVVNPFDPEEMIAYEVGVKGFTADRRIRIDMALFFNDWQDIVLRQLYDISPQSGLAFDQPTGLNVNAGDAEVWGWEFTTDIAFTDNLTGRLTAAYTDSQLANAQQTTYSLFPSFYTSDPSCAPAAIQALADPNPDSSPSATDTNEAQDAKASQCRDISGDLSGNTQMRQPEWTGSASLTYRDQLAGDWEWFTRADANYTGKIFLGNDNQSWLGARTNVNLRLGVESPRYSVEFWVRNLFEEDSPTAAFRDIYWANDSDLQAVDNPASIRESSTFDDFPPLRYSVSYPSLRTFGLVAKMRFGGAEK